MFGSPMMLSRSLTPTVKLIKAPITGVKAVSSSKKILPTLNVSTLPKVSRDNIASQTDSGDFDPDRGIEQFSKLEQDAINDALALGRTDELPAKLKAYVDYQVALRDKEIVQGAGAEAALQEQATQVALQQAADEEARQAAIAKRKKQQLMVNLFFGIGGLGLVYFLATRD